MSKQVGAASVAEPSPVFELPDFENEPVFIVDDDRTVLEGMHRFLTRAGYNARSFTLPAEALTEIRDGIPEVMVTDMDMPGMTGLELAEKALEIDPEIRIILVTGAGDEGTAQAALRQGLDDYLIKPVDFPDLGRAVQKAFMERALDEFTQEVDVQLREEVGRQTRVIQEVTFRTLVSLLNALEARSPHFKGHSQSVARCAAGIARELDLPPYQVKSVRTAGLLHDVGMIAVPDAVVHKRGKLNSEEYEAIVQHCRKGAEILQPLGHLDPVITFVLEHHERLDGSGYPDGKKDDEISLGGQIVGLAEAWTALTEQRSYRAGMSAAEAMGTLVGVSNVWFTAELVEALKISQT